MNDADLFAAFIAGFENSAEGYNGEWRPSRRDDDGVWYEPELTDELAEVFERWRATRGATIR